MQNSVAVIGQGAFDGCTKLQTIKLPKSLNSIEEHAFLLCTSLLDITVPSNVKNIGDHAMDFYTSEGTMFSLADGFTLYGVKDSVAEIYAVENELTFKEALAPVYVLGDSDGDGSVTIMDATQLQMILSQRA